MRSQAVNQIQKVRNGSKNDRLVYRFASAGDNAKSEAFIVTARRASPTALSARHKPRRFNALGTG
jgi:hypothetical protein